MVKFKKKLQWKTSIAQSLFFQVVENVLATINQVNAVYHHSSLGQEVNFAVVRFEIMEEMPEELGDLDGERIGMLRAFCG